MVIQTRKGGNLSKKWRLLMLVPLMVLPFGPAISGSMTPKTDLFSQPKNFESVLEESKKATFEIWCEYWVGSGWAIKLEEEYYLVTAGHVVEECLDSGQILAKNNWHGAFDLTLLSFDLSYWSDDATGEKDLALLKSSKVVDAFQLQPTAPTEGQWVMALGYPAVAGDDGHFSVTTGRITGLAGHGLIAVDAAINTGNSGGPLINSAGDVVGTVFAGEDTAEYESISYAQEIALHCGVAFLCEKDAPLERLPPAFTRTR